MFVLPPAILIGGPPHSGKSVFLYSLTRALRRRGIPHYALRACPDGEGDWANEADQHLVKTIRVKGDFTDSFVAQVIQDLQHRRLPLLVDVGGRPTPEQQEIFDHCTHAVLLISREDEAKYLQEKAHWQQMMVAHSVQLIAVLDSYLTKQDVIDDSQPVLRGSIAGLLRGEVATGKSFEATVAAVTQHMVDENTIDRHHQIAPMEAALIDLESYQRQLNIKDHTWLPQHLSQLLSLVPAGQSIAVYGRLVNWLIAALALHVLPAPLWLFDSRLGWIQPPHLPEEGQGAPPSAWQVSITNNGDYMVLHLNTEGAVLPFDQPQHLPLPQLPQGECVVISGRVPSWLLVAVVRQLHHRQQRIAVYQPQLAGAVIVHDKKLKSIGEVLPVTIG